MMLPDVWPTNKEGMKISESSLADMISRASLSLLYTITASKLAFWA